MSARFEELAWRETPMGEISLRRRREPTLDVDVYEVKLGDEYLMSSLFTVAEEELARLGLAAHTGDRLDVLVGGLGLGYTAVAALADPRVSALSVVEALPDVVDWHAHGLLPCSAALTSDPRTTLVTADFFATVGAGEPLSPERPDAAYDVLLVDIDHTPGHVLHPSHAAFYTDAGLRRMATRLRPGGVFALWSDDPPDEPFVALLSTVFPDVDARVVEFDNFLTGGTSANTVYVAR
jgi:spermidine synthase